MQAGQWLSLFFIEHTTQVKQAAHVSRDKIIRLCGGNILDLQTAHSRRYIGKTDGKSAAESAALIHFSKLGQIKPVNAGK